MAAPAFTCLIALFAKRGERTALRELTRADQLRGVQPLLHLVPGTDLDQQLHQVQKVLRHLDELGRPAMVDANAVVATGAGVAGPLTSLFERLNPPQQNLFDPPVRFIPVVRPDGPELPGIGRLCGELGAGAAVRITRRSHAAALGPVVERLGLADRHVDVIVDLGYVTGVGPALADAVPAAVDQVGSAGEFRSVTVLSGSVPPRLGHTDALHQPRFEEQLWAAAHREGRRVRLGDYGVVHPVLSTGIRRSKHVTVKYTCPGEWLYLREPLVAGGGPDDDEKERARTLRLVCRHLVEDEHFAGPEYSWGDREIADGAGGLGSGWGGSHKPVALGTSHHLAYLAERAA
jgi:Beta protein